MSQVEPSIATVTAQEPAEAVELLEQIGIDPETVLGLRGIPDDYVPPTADDNGYIQHLITELSVGNETLDGYKHLDALKQVIFQFWEEGYSGGFAAYGRVALIHWIRTITLKHLSETKEGHPNWLEVYDHDNAAALQDGDIDGMFANATRKQLECLTGKGFDSIEELDLFVKYLDCAVGFSLLSPLTGEDSEWVDQTEASGGPMWQNKRCGAVFKGLHPRLGEGIIPYYLDSFVFSDDFGFTWFTGSSSSTPIVFPYTPRTVYAYTEKIDTDEFKMVTEWRHEPSVGMKIRHHEGKIYEIIGIAGDQVGLRDNQRQETTQVRLDELTKVYTEGKISYPNYFPLLTDEERDLLDKVLDEKWRLEKEERDRRGSAVVAPLTEEVDEPMPEVETQEEFEAAEERARNAPDTVELTPTDDEPVVDKE